jgi:hypothetical protein
MNVMPYSMSKALSMKPQMDLVTPRLLTYAGADTERSSLAWILNTSERSVLRVMSETGVTLSRFLMRRSTATVPVAMASCLSVVEEENQAVIGWMA